VCQALFADDFRVLRIKKMMRRLLLVLFISAAVFWPILGRLLKVYAQTSKEKAVDFNREIRPILSDNCFTCHGPDEKQRMAGLRFDTKEGAFARAGVIVAGDSANSKLYQRISAKDADRLMPPLYSGHKLTDRQIESLRRWIDEGAKWETHWAYIAPQNPTIPLVKNSAWPRNPIDKFIQARLEKEGLQPSAEADKATLLRRVSFDLTGLPPSLEELEAFLADHSPDAYEKCVDRLLASKHFGERMAMQWLDLARYADTHGYHIDSHRDMWVWRDWVINAFNQNKPFDQFTVEQLAGDLLPDATIEQRIATGFNRNHMINFEGGAIPEEYQVEYVIDRVETTANTWLGMTLGCARCHNHKYDPITQKEFYQFFAFFNTVAEEGLDGRTGNAAPVLALPSTEQVNESERLSATIKKLEDRLAQKDVTQAQEAWEKQFVNQVAQAPRNGLIAHYELDGNLSDSSGNYHNGRTVRGDPAFTTGILGRALNFDGDTQVSFGNYWRLGLDEPFSLSFWVNGSGNKPVNILQKAANAETGKGFEVDLDDFRLIGIQRYAARVGFKLASDNESGIYIRVREPVAMGVWQQVTFTYDGSGKANGLRAYINGVLKDCDILQDNLNGLTNNASDLGVGSREQGKSFRGAIDDLRIYGRVLDRPDIEQLAIRYPIQALLTGVFGKRTKEGNSRVRDYFLTYASDTDLQNSYKELKSVRKQKEELDKHIQTVMVMSEMSKPRETYVLGRGDYRNKLEKVSANVPAILPQMSKEPALNRLALARWLVDSTNPLTARVIVNRFWQMYFGLGIVKTSEDFGSQGEPPVHPELLDWLALEFMKSGWNIKAMQRLIVTSATYRQSSKSSQALVEKDPENRLLARGARFRLSAEMIRDSALVVSGLLNREISGASVFPYQPKGLWEEMAFGDGFSAQEYKQSKGKDLYRRSLYTFWKRTVPPPSLVTFDAPDREKCVGRRVLTNTPLQSLILLNDPLYTEAALKLAGRVLETKKNDTSSRLILLYRLVLQRNPSMAEIKILGTLLKQQLAIYQDDTNKVQKAWTIACSTVLNLDEAIVRE
jgi:hypothetical protein